MAYIFSILEFPTTRNVYYVDWDKDLNDLGIFRKPELARSTEPEPVSGKYDAIIGITCRLYVLKIFNSMEYAPFV